MAKDDPLYPDPHFDYEHGILKNLPGFTNQKKLDDFERVQATKASPYGWPSVGEIAFVACTRSKSSSFFDW